MNGPLHQGGAASLMAIVTLMLAVLFAALAIDTARLGWEAKRLQKIADLAAMEAIASAGLCSGVTALEQSAFEAAAQASAVRHGYGGDLAAEGGVVTGVLATVGGKRNFTPAAITAANALQVTARNTVPSSLVAGGWLGGTTFLQRRAVAHDEILGGFWAGSFFASVDSDDSLVLNALLGGLLGGSVNLSALSYEGLMDAQVTLGALASAAGPGGVGLSAGTVESFLQAEMTAGEFLQVMAQALPDGHLASASLNELVSVTTNLNSIAIGELLSVTADNPESAAEANLNLFDLVSAAAQISNEGNTVSIPVTLALPLVSGEITISLYIEEGPRYAFGPPGVDVGGDWITQVRTSSARLQVDMPLGGDLSILGVTVSIDGALSLYAELAPAAAWLETVQCANAATLAHLVHVGVQSGYSQLGIGRFDDITDPSSGVSDSPALDVDVDGGLVSLTADLSASSQAMGGQGGYLAFVVNHANPLPQTDTAGTPLGDALNSATGSLAASLEVTLSGGGLTGLLLSSVGLTEPLIASGLEEALAPLLTGLDELLLDPLFRALGMHLGGVDIRLDSIKRGETRLAG